MIQREIQTKLNREQIELVSRALARLEIKSTLIKDIKLAQDRDDWCKNKVQTVSHDSESNFKVNDNVLSLEIEYMCFQEVNSDKGF